MCFAPQRRALFQHLNFQKYSDVGVFCTVWLRNVLRATTACTFSSSQLPKVLREWCVLHILTSKRALRHNGHQFFISHLARWLRTRRFSEPTFPPSAATNHWKNVVFCDSLLFRALAASFLWFVSLLWSSSSLLWHIVGSLAAKLPWMILPCRMRYGSNTFDFPPVQLASFCFATFHERMINP